MNEIVDPWATLVLMYLGMGYAAAVYSIRKTMPRQKPFFITVTSVSGLTLLVGLAGVSIQPIGPFIGWLILVLAVSWTATEIADHIKELEGKIEALLSEMGSNDDIGPRGAKGE